MRSYKACVPFALLVAAFLAGNLVVTGQAAAQQFASASPAPAVSPAPVESPALSSSPDAPEANLLDQSPIFQRALLDLTARREAVAQQAPRLTGAAQRQFLARNLSQALEQTSQVEAEFRDVLQRQQLPEPDAELFDAVRTRYRDAEHDVDGSGKFLHAGLQLRRNGSNSPMAETLNALNYNENVFRTLTGDGPNQPGLFDLKVVSYPAGAKITFWESSSDEVQYANTAGTGTTITALPISVWYVRAELPNHTPITQTYDAYVQTDAKLVFDFNSK